MLVLAACTGGGSPRIEVEIASFDPSGLLDVLPLDQIPSIDLPTFEPARSVRGLGASAPVVAVDVDAHARAYPLEILLVHEVVNDEIAGRTIAVTYSPLCNAAVVFARAVAGRTLTFGGSGKLYRSNLVMYDRETRSLWPQMLGLAARGELKGVRLDVIPSGLVSFGDFRRAFPDGEVLAPPGGVSHGAGAYRLDPYAGYDARSGPLPHLFRLEPDARASAMDRVVGIEAGGEARAYPYPSPARARVVHDTIGGLDVVVFWGGGARAALDAGEVSKSRVVGGTGVFEPSARGRLLTFEARAGGFVDRQTGSGWSLLGRALSGPLRGARLEPVPHLDAFWFAWAAFHPGTDLRDA